jgi:hypothetical protein
MRLLLQGPDRPLQLMDLVEKWDDHSNLPIEVDLITVYDFSMTEP